MAVALLFPIDALQGLKTVPAQDAEVALDGLAVGRLEPEGGQRHGEFVEGALHFALLILFHAGERLDLGAEVVHAVERDRAPG